MRIGGDGMRTWLRHSYVAVWFEKAGRFGDFVEFGLFRRHFWYIMLPCFFERKI